MLDLGENPSIKAGEATSAKPAAAPRAAVAPAQPQTSSPGVAPKRWQPKHKGEKDEDESNSERWLVSYADFITLVMVMFITLYALQLVKAKGAVASELRSQDKAQMEAKAPEPRQKPDAAEIESELLAHLQALRDSGQVKLTKSARGMEIEINARLLFPSGDARLLPQSLSILKSIAKALRNLSQGTILVEGHTDSVPILNGRFESNWELSSARAGAVVRHFVDNGIEPSRLVAMGRADNVPAALGTTPEALAVNRRVTILVQY
jgi:chemotaxis protein MotB